PPTATVPPSALTVRPPENSAGAVKLRNPGPVLVRPEPGVSSPTPPASVRLTGANTWYVTPWLKSTRPDRVRSLPPDSRRSWVTNRLATACGPPALPTCSPLTGRTSPVPSAVPLPTSTHAWLLPGLPLRNTDPDRPALVPDRTTSPPPCLK